jgi:hypothetical protein
MADSTEGQIGFEQVGIASILKRHRLLVPANQREYAWDDEHVRNLFEDIARAISENESSYFLGTVVTIPRDGRLEVVDGQQRLATTALLLHAIVEYLAEDDAMVANAIRNETLFVTDRRRRELVPRLTLNLVDNDYFKAVLTNVKPLPAPTKPSHKLILRAAGLAKDHVKKIVGGHNKNDHGNVLNNWVDFLEDRAAIVLLIVSDDANAYRMFETLNDRGLRVSQADLIKNYLYGRAQDRLPEVELKWALVRGALENLEGEDALIDFIRHSLIVTQGFVREAQLYEKVQGTARAPQQVVSFVNSLEALAVKYVAIQNPEHEDWNGYLPSSRKAIEVLNLFAIKPMRPIVFAAAAKMSKKECDLAFKLLVSLGVRLFIAGSTRTGSIEMALSTAANRIYSREIKTALQLRVALKDVIPSDSVFAGAFATAKVSNGKFSRYYLRSLEAAETGGTDPWHTPVDDYTVVNLEHILPKKPMGNWPQFGTDEEAREFTTRLGNQALLLAADNSSQGSDKFEDKKPAFKKSPYHFTKMVGDAPQWTKDEINARQLKMAQLASATWKV